MFRASKDFATMFSGLLARDAHTSDVYTVEMMYVRRSATLAICVNTAEQIELAFGLLCIQSVRKLSHVADVDEDDAERPISFAANAKRQERLRQFGHQ